MYAITGATGGFGSSAINHLINQGINPEKIVGLAKNKKKAAKLEARGIIVRIGNYNDPVSLENAFKGISKLLLVSGSEVGQRETQHKNVIKAAKQSGVKQIVYTSITRADTSGNPLAPEHKATEEALKKSGLEYVILRNNWYTENFIGDVKAADDLGIISTATGSAQVASALRSEYAEAAAKVLYGSGHAGKTYELSGKLWDYNDLATAASSIYQKPVEYKPVTPEERTRNLIGAGLDKGIAGFLTALDASIAEGSLEIESHDLAFLLGRDPLSLEEGLRTLLEQME